MNTAFSEMLLRLNTPENINSGAKLSVLERQQARIKWQAEHLLLPPPQVQQLGLNYFDYSDELNVFSSPGQAQQFHGLIADDQNLGGLLTQGMKLDPGVGNTGCSNIGSIGGGSFGFGDSELGNVTGFGMNYAVSRTASCPPSVAAAMAEVATAAASKAKQTVLPEKLSSSAGRESFKKRKPDKTQNQKVCLFLVLRIACTGTHLMHGSPNRLTIINLGKSPVVYLFLVISDV